MILFLVHRITLLIAHIYLSTAQRPTEESVLLNASYVNFYVTRTDALNCIFFVSLVAPVLSPHLLRATLLCYRLRNVEAMLWEYGFSTYLVLERQSQLYVSYFVTGQRKRQKASFLLFFQVHARFQKRVACILMPAHFNFESATVFYEMEGD